MIAAIGLMKGLMLLIECLSFVWFLFIFLIDPARRIVRQIDDDRKTLQEVQRKREEADE